MLITPTTRAIMPIPDGHPNVTPNTVAIMPKPDSKPNITPPDNKPQDLPEVPAKKRRF